MLRIKDTQEYLEDEVIVEYSLSIYLNGRYFITLLCTPDSLEELTVGYLYSESVISSMENLENVEIDEAKGKAMVRLKNEDVFSYMGDNLISQKTVTTGCGRGRTITFPIVADGIEKKIIPIEMDPDRIFELMNLFNKMSKLFESTGGVHSCALCNYDEIIYFEDDIGRHNALDKILGRALIDGLELS
ncbi:MAG: sulfurtransferase FdhD, partial [Eubacteriaceae bacterium]|nr:sulfurtransferase FdhD [Eubacteriaceae bacterium]